MAVKKIHIQKFEAKENFEKSGEFLLPNTGFEKLKEPSKLRGEELKNLLGKLMFRIWGTSDGLECYVGPNVHTNLETLAHLFEKGEIEPGQLSEDTRYVSFIETIIPILNFADKKPLKGDKRKISASFRIYGHELINKALQEYSEKGKTRNLEVRLSLIRKRPTLIVKRPKKSKG